jgi:SAM-dependent methyltransferase/uncharacterized protein YbaR (Trm112 family)
MLPSGALTCVRCGSGGLEVSGRHIDCPLCGAMYPVLAGVPVMFGDAVLAPAPRLDEPMARSVLQAFELPVDPIAVLRIRQASGRRVRLGNALAEAEGGQFLERVRSTGHRLPAGAAPPAPATAAGPPAAGEDAPRYRWLKDYIPRLLPPGQDLTANLRFENSGRVVIRHAGPAPVVLAYRWLDEDDRPVPHEDQRTPLPTDVPPGRQLTAPIRLRTPAAPGRYRLRLSMIEEGVRPLEADAKVLPIHVSAAAAAASGRTPAGWTVNPEAPPSYDADHVRAAGMLADWLGRHAPDRPRILEIGGNAYPMIAGLDGELYNVDVDLLGLQVGSMVRRARGGSVNPICADAENLPFPRGFFDAIVVVASLHHFPDPAAALRAMRGRLAPGGFIGLFCEPVGHIWPGAVDPAFLAELEKGVNEQSFSMAEYAMIFRDAGLRAEEVIVDFNSLKARLARPGTAA